MIEKWVTKWMPASMPAFFMISFASISCKKCGYKCKNSSITKHARIGFEESPLKTSAL